MGKFMTADTLEERKKKINDIKNSLSQTTPEKEEPVFKFSKVRLLIAVLIFVAFVYCDRNQVKISGYTTKDLYKMIEGNLSFEQIINGDQYEKTSFK